VFEFEFFECGLTGKIIDVDGENSRGCAASNGDIKIWFATPPSFDYISIDGGISNPARRCRFFRPRRTGEHA
jgi:hypothetical protein